MEGSFAGRRVLIVDDDASIRATMTEALVMEGYEVAQAANGAEALQIVERIHPDVVLVDLWMPVLDGWGFRREQLRRYPELPVVIMSATKLDARQLRELGEPRVVDKPFELDALFSAVDAVLAPR